MVRQTFRFYPGRKHVVVLVLIVAAVYVLLPQLGDFRSSWQLLSRPKVGYTAEAILLTFATFAAGAATYCFLSFGRLRYKRTLLVQLAATFINRLLPAGIGALGANYLYLRHERHSAGRAGSIVAINNLLGFVGHGLLLVIVLLVSQRTLTPRGWHGPHSETLLKAAAAVAILVVLGLLLGRRRLSKVLSDLMRQLSAYRRRPRPLIKALGTSLILTLCNVLCLYFCLKALSLHLSFASIMLVFTFGLGAGSIVPTPGGLGAFEAGLTAGLVAYGIDPAPALAAALLYRLISYWLPLLAGAAAFVACQRHGLFGV